MYEMRRKPEPTLLPPKGSLNLPWYETNWPLMRLKVIHSGEMDCSTAKLQQTPVPRATVPLP